MQTDKYNSLLHYTQPTVVTMTQQLHMIPAWYRNINNYASTTEVQD